LLLGPPQKEKRKKKSDGNFLASQNFRNSLVVNPLVLEDRRKNIGCDLLASLISETEKHKTLA
jgi:hypothetical protein